MHRKYIKKLFLGELRPVDSLKFETKEYHKHSREFTKLYREIQALLPKDQKKKLEILCDEHTAMRAEAVTDAFVNGFKLGMNLSIESFYPEKN